MVVDGKEYVKKYLESFSQRLEKYKNKTSKTLGIAVVEVKPDLPSVSYLKRIIKTAESVGVSVYQCDYSYVSNTEQLICEIEKRNYDSKINGIIVHLPLPEYIDKDRVINAISQHKDIDGMTSINAGMLLLGDKKAYCPSTPLGVMVLLKMLNVEISGKRAVVLGRSNIVGKPMSILLQNENATVTVCHSKTKDIASVVRENDIVVSAIGRAGFVTADMVKKDAVVMDVGVSFVDGVMKGDVDFQNVKEVASIITPVPNGCGPMTVCMLLENTLKSAISQLD